MIYKNEDEALELIKELSKHIWTSPEYGILRPKSFWDQFIEWVPECYFEGSAYRGVAKSEEEILLDDLETFGTSWSKSISGVHCYMEREKKTRYLIYESKVKGIDLNVLTEALRKKYFNSHEKCREIISLNLSKNEEEIILFENIGTISLKNT